MSIAAPGTDVVSLSPRDDGLINASEGPDNTMVAPAGTSFSAAIVSGVAALVRAKFPELTSHQVINRLIRTARPPARGVDNQIGHGIVDPVAALTYDVPAGEAVPPERLSAPLVVPAPVSRDMTPVWVALGGVGAVAALVAGGGRAGGHGAIEEPDDESDGAVGRGAERGAGYRRLRGGGGAAGGGQPRWAAGGRCGRCWRRRRWR